MDFAAATAARSYAATRPATTPDPSAAIGNAAQDFLATLQKGEATAEAAMTGQTDPHSLVEALAQTKLAVETVATVRDKVVEAYQEILRMPV